MAPYNGLQEGVMNILLIESPRNPSIETEWLKQYMNVYDPTINVDGVTSLREAVEYLQEPAMPVDIMLLDPTVPDALTPTGIPHFIQAAPKTPVVILETGKVLHTECTRTKETRLYHLRTDVTRDTFLHHLREIVKECAAESGEVNGPSE